MWKVVGRWVWVTFKEHPPLETRRGRPHDSNAEAGEAIAVDRVKQSLKSILTEECSALEKENFCFPKSVPVTWRIKTS
jgi:hypothetical protein